MGIRNVIVTILLMGPATTWGEVVQKLEGRIVEAVECEAQESQDVLELMENQLVAKKFLEWGLRGPAVVELSKHLSVDVAIQECVQMTMTWLEKPPTANTSIHWYEVYAEMQFAYGDETEDDTFVGIVSLDRMELVNHAKSSAASPVPGEPELGAGWPDDGRPWPAKPNPRQLKKGEFLNI